MAVGDLFWLEEALPYIMDQSSAFSSGDTITCRLVTDATITSTYTSTFETFTEAATSGTYPASGSTLGTWGDMWSTGPGSKTATFDSAINPSWLQDTDNSTNITYAVVCNITDAGDRCLAVVDLGGVNGRAGDLTITWNASGIATVTST